MSPGYPRVEPKLTAAFDPVKVGDEAFAAGETIAGGMLGNPVIAGDFRDILLVKETCQLRGP
jgi:hypothetical protein